MRKKTVTVIVIVLLVLIIVGVIIYFTNKKSAGNMTLPIATIWGAPLLSDKTTLDYENADKNVQMARRGFTRGLESGKGDLHIVDNQISEMAGVNDLILKIGDSYREDEILMTVGGSTDETTMYTAMAMNFFQIPMVIPFSDGDSNINETVSDYSMRMMPRIDDYTNFFDVLFNGIIFDYIRSQFQNGPAPEISEKVGIFFYDNFNGNNQAVSISQKLMDNGFDIDFYVPYTNLFAIQNTWNQAATDIKKVDYVIIIGEDTGSMILADEMWHLWADQGLSPLFVLTGFIPDELSDDLKNADNVLFVQPILDYSNCPSDIRSITEAMGYAAGLVTAKALRTAVETQPAEQIGLNLIFKSSENKVAAHQEYVDSFRSNIYNALMNINEDIPCYGHVNFKNRALSQHALQLVRYTGVYQYDPVESSIVSDRILEKYLGSAK